MVTTGNLRRRVRAVIGRITGPAILDGRDGVFASEDPTMEFADVAPSHR